jgi:hypothetical protein
MGLAKVQREAAEDRKGKVPAAPGANGTATRQPRAPKP